MLKSKTGMGMGRVVLGSLLAIGLAAPANAGTVYSWITANGTFAFTDDAKRIPANHRDDAQRRTMGKLNRYDRFTPVAEARTEPYADRIVARRDALRDVGAVAPQAAVAGAGLGAGTGLTLPVAAGRSGALANPSLFIPVEGGTAQARSENADQPLVFESKRMDDPGRLTTRHWTFVTRGDEVVTVIKGEHRQRGLTELVREKDFDYWDPQEDR